MLRRVASVLIYICLSLSLHGVAHAQTDWFAKAKAARDAKDYAKTIKYLRKAYDESPSPVLLNNIAKIYEKMGDYLNASKTYKIVVDDPNAPSDLRQLDHERWMRLKPKLSQVHVVVSPAVNWRRVWLTKNLNDLEAGWHVIDPLSASDTNQDIGGRERDAIEYSVETSELVVDVLPKDGKIIHRVLVEARPGRRLTLRRRLINKNTKKSGLVSWRESTVKMKRISIDDIPFKGSLRKLEGMRLAPGSYSVRIAWVGRKVERRTIRLQAGKTFQLKPLKEERISAAVSTQVPNEKFAVPTNPVRDRVEARPSLGLDKIGQLALAVAGLGMMTAGSILYFDADSERQDTVIEAQKVRLLGEADSGALLAQWSEDNKTLTDKMNKNLGMVYSGTALVATSAVWWALTRATDQAVSVSYEPSGFVWLEGRYTW